MKIIVDTNIVFSGILNTKGKICDLIMNSEEYFEFYSCNYLRYELKKYYPKLKQISKLTYEQIKESEYLITKQIKFYNEEQISEKIWDESKRLVKDIDINDIAFVAMTKHINGYLWTGDKPLHKGLKIKGFKNVFNTNELFAKRQEIETKSLNGR